MSARTSADLDSPSAADLRAALARSRLYAFSVAAVLQIHPATLGAYLNERRPLARDLAVRISTAIAQLEAQAAAARSEAGT